MKKIFLIFIFFLGFCFVLYKINDIKLSNEEVTNVFIEKDEEVRSVFISYIDYSLLKGKNKEEQMKIIDDMINNVSNMNFNNIILQVRSFADAIYESKIFLSSSKVVLNEGDLLPLDILEYFIEKCHEKNISLYAWINPYRIRNSNNFDDIGHNSYFMDWFGTDKIVNSDNGIYFNPSSDEVLELIIDGVAEIVLNYDVDGILYDDYFYPNTNMDLDNYNEYIKTNNISLNEYRINIINNLLDSTNKKIKEIKKDVLFGISPTGNIENNINGEYLDVNQVIKNKYIDFIIPQLYYGFFNDTKPFLETSYVWDNLIDNDIDLYIGLGIYKSGVSDKYAGGGSNEWVDNKDIIKKQIIVSRGLKNYKGFAIFRYSYLFSYYNDILDEEIKNLNSLMK